MKRALLLIGLLLGLTLPVRAACTAATCGRVLNPFTGKLDFIGGGTVACLTLLDTGGTQLWNVTVNDTGSLVTTQVNSASVAMASGCTRLNQLTLADPAGVYYSVSIMTDGTLVTTAGGGYASSIGQVWILTSGSSGITWLLTVDASANLVTS